VRTDPPAPALPAIPQLKEKWSVTCQAKLPDASPRFDDDGQVLALVATTGPAAAAGYNPKTGAAFARELTLPGGKARVHQTFALDKGKLAIQTDAGKDLIVWDPVTGKTTPRGLPPVTPDGIPYLNLSANGQYVAVGHAPPAPGAKNPPATPLKVINTTTNKPVVSIDWQVGQTAFTADASQVLVVDGTDQFQWFKLPGGKLEAKWSFGRVAGSRLMGTSAKGEVILHYGRPPDRDEEVHLLNGTDGAVLHSFPAKQYGAPGGSVSDDGKRVLLVRTGPNPAAEILDASGTRLAAVALPAAGADGLAVSWKAGLVVTYDRATRVLTAYDLAPR
jgi:hypothetical protein